MKAKVLFVASVSFHLERFHLPFMEALIAEGCEVHAASSPPPGHGLGCAGVLFHPVEFTRTPFSFRQAEAYRQIRGLIKAENYDLIHVHTPAASFITRLAAWRTQKTPVLYTAHGFHFYKGAPLRNWLLYYPAERLASKWTSGLVVMNREDFARAGQFGFVEGRSLFLTHGVGCDLELFTPESLGIARDRVIVCCLGELNRNKNQSLLLEAWRQMGSASKDAELWIAGDGPWRDRLRSMVKEMRLSGVHFLGFRQDIPRVLGESDILAHVSKREGLPCAVMEAMASGLPVVATDIRGNRDLVTEKTGILVPPGDAASLARALSGLIADPEKRTAMGANARLSMTEYDLKKVVSEMMAIYRKFLPGL